MYECRECGEDVESIVEIVMHPCKHVLQGSDLRIKEQDTLLYIKSRVLDHRGELDWMQMNYEDQQNIKLFKADNLLKIEEDQVMKINEGYWELVKECERLRAKRNQGNMEIE
jgi:hypothetical protein